MSDKYITRRARSDADGEGLKRLFDKIFHPEEVGSLARTIFHHLPRMERKYWFIAEDEDSGQIVSAFALLPWTLELDGVALKVAEMGIVGTLEEHRGKGLMRRLNAEFDRTLAEERFDLSIIQGIPGFYQQFGFHYALPLENHINLPLHAVAEKEDRKPCSFRLAGLEDMPFLLREDATYRSSFSISSVRDEANWHYMLTESRQTEYRSEFWIMEGEGGERFYFRVPQDGFGKGLIISEISEAIHYDALESLLLFCREKALERDKPYIRLNLHGDSAAGRMAVSMGAEAGRPYAWQIKFPNIENYLKKIAPVFEKRMQASAFAGYTGTFRLNFFKKSVDLVWSGGRLAQVRPGEGDCGDTFSIAADLFPSLCLGHRSWRDLQQIRPDIFPSSGKSALLAETLFPPTVSWIHEQY